MWLGLSLAWPAGAAAPDYFTEVVSPNLELGSLRVGDLDGDGAADLFGRTPAGDLAYATNGGTGTFDPPVVVLGAAERGGAEALLDLDGDGDLDLVATSPAELLWWENVGGAFVGPLTVVAGTSIGEVVQGDLDGDGDADLLYVVRGSDEVRWLERAPAGFGAEALVATLPDASETRLGDVDADGDLDLLVETTAGLLDPDELWLLPNLGGGLFGPGGRVVSRDLLYASHLVDVDEDGVLDVLSSDLDVVFWQRGTGAGGFGAPTWVVPLPGVTIQQIADLDGDGDGDALVQADVAGGGVGWLEQVGGELVPRAIAAGAWSEASAADLDADGDLDVNVGGWGLNEVTWLVAGQWRRRTGGDLAGADLVARSGDLLEGTFTGVGAFVVRPGARVRVAPGAPLVVEADSVTVAGTLDASGAGHAGGGGWFAGEYLPGAGPGAGTPGVAYTYSSAGGGANGGDGGDGGQPPRCYGPSSIGSGGASYGSAGDTADAPLGSGGASGTATELGSAGGGAGGGSVTLRASTTLVIEPGGAILADGRGGGDPTGDWGGNGAGGGAGGTIVLVAPDVEVNGALSARGGDGGRGVQSAYCGGAGGGGGGGGRVKIEGTVTGVPQPGVVAGGSGGGAPGGRDGAAGQVGTVSIAP